MVYLLSHDTVGELIGKIFCSNCHECNSTSMLCTVGNNYKNAAYIRTSQNVGTNIHVPACVQIIWASLSEPHTSDTTNFQLYLSIYVHVHVSIYVCVCCCPPKPPTHAHMDQFFIYCTDEGVCCGCRG